jgi:hypothetical protein
VLDDLEYEDSEPPAIGLVHAGVPWEDVQDLCRAKTRAWPLTWRFALARPPCGTR